MPLPALPLILLIASSVAGAGGIGAGVHGTVKMHNAGELMNEANALHEINIEKFRKQNVDTCGVMYRLGMLELSVLQSFELCNR